MLLQNCNIILLFPDEYCVLVSIQPSIPIDAQRKNQYERADLLYNIGLEEANIVINTDQMTNITVKACTLIS